MVDALWLCLAGLSALIGTGCMALSLDAHWRQVLSEAPLGSRSQRLRFTGGLGIAAALLFCLFADHASMAVLVWVMFLATTSIFNAFLLTWRPQWLRVLALPF